MRSIIIIFLCGIISIACTGDSGDDNINIVTTIQLSETSATFRNNITSKIITVQSNDNAWAALSSREWCTAKKIDNGTLSITVSPYTSPTKRTANITVSVYGIVYHSIVVEQEGHANAATYTVPIIYTVLYDKTEGKNFPYSIVENNYETLRSFFRNQYAPNASIDINIDFVLADTDPNGNKIDPPGLRFVELPKPIGTMLYRDPLTEYPSNIQWDPNDYVNIYVYKDTIVDITGFATLPYTSVSNPLTGLYATDFYNDGTKPLTTIRGVMLNSTYLKANSKSTVIVHEMGHYLGLFHAFSQYGCEGTDYCDDTPNYDFSKYNPAIDGNNRVACDGTKFVSHNVMDYERSYRDQFTADQKARMIHVMQHSPLIAGGDMQKARKSVAKATTSTVSPPPVQFME